MNTVATATVMKVNVASSDRGDILARPHTPCPLVHPPPKRVPNPTSNPDTASKGSPCANTIGPNPRIAAGSTSPMRNASRQPRAPITPVTVFSKMPLIPRDFTVQQQQRRGPGADEHSTQ